MTLEQVAQIGQLALRLGLRQTEARHEDDLVGANDVTNPAARRPGTPVSGMPILDVDKAQNVVVMKRGRGKGYAGIENELYFEPNTQMLFGDAKAGLQSVIAAVKELIS